MEAGWRQAGGRLKAGWRQAGDRLEAGWRQAGGRLEIGPAQPSPVKAQPRHSPGAAKIHTKFKRWEAEPARPDGLS